jgi:PBSX family phage portal protein
MTKKRITQAASEKPTNVVDIKKRAKRNVEKNRELIEKYMFKLVEKRGEDTDTNPSAPGKSNANSNDPFTTLAAEGRIIEPPYNLFALSMLPEQSSELGQCVDAMASNIDQLGHRQMPRVKLDDPSVTGITDKLRKDIQTEEVFLKNFFEYCTTESFTEFRLRLRKDLENTGNQYFEIIRDIKDNIQSFNHLPSYQMRLSKMDDDAIMIDRKIMKMQVDDYAVVIDTAKEYRRFRKYVQGRFVSGSTGSVSMSSKLIWFKSFGDPRRLNKNTGEYENDEIPVKDADLATEVIHKAIYSARSPYGLPRYIGNLLSIYGDRAAEEINFITFKNNNIPSMMILVSGGQITPGTIKRLESFTESQVQGSDNRSKFIIVEAESSSDEGEDNGQAKITVEHMVKDQHNDALFQNYSEKNQDKIRRAFRLPPLLVGRADDYTRTTAETSKRIADEQVFTPERDEHDSVWNRMIYPEMGIRYHKFKSNTPSTTDNESLINILALAEKTGGVTPRIARKILEMILSDDLGGFPKDFKSDVPFSLSMAEAVKNVGDPAEPGQQVTALKQARTIQILKAILGDDILPEELGETDPVAYVLKRYNEKIESTWQEEVTKSGKHADHA